jgi:hypothetical protein
LHIPEVETIFPAMGALILSHRCCSFLFLFKPFLIYLKTGLRSKRAAPCGPALNSRVLKFARIFLLMVVERTFYNRDTTQETALMNPTSQSAMDTGRQIEHLEKRRGVIVQ